MYIKNFNGTEVSRLMFKLDCRPSEPGSRSLADTTSQLHPDSDSRTLPPAIHNVSRGIVELHPGDFVLLQAQFRIGDGRRAGIRKDPIALAHLFGLTVLPLRSPWTWTGGEDSDPAAVDAALDASLGPGTIAGELTATFSGGAIDAYYHDFVRRGERAHIESHYGRAHVALWEQRCREAGQGKSGKFGSPRAR